MLDLLKRERGAEDSLEADMWCHFGRARIRAPDEGTMHFSYIQVKDKLGK